MALTCLVREAWEPQRKNKAFFSSKKKRKKETEQWVTKQRRRRRKGLRPVKKKMKKQRRRRWRIVSYRPIRPGEVFKYRPESATEQNGNAAKKKEEEDEEAKKKKKKGLSRWRLRIKSTSIFGFKFFFLLTGRFPFSGRNTPIFSWYGPIWVALTRVGESTWQDVAWRAVSGVTPASPRPAELDAGAAPLEPRPCIPEYNIMANQMPSKCLSHSTKQRRRNVWSS